MNWFWCEWMKIKRKQIPASNEFTDLMFNVHAIHFIRFLGCFHHCSPPTGTLHSKYYIAWADGHHEHRQTSKHDITFEELCLHFVQHFRFDLFFTTKCHENPTISFIQLLLLFLLLQLQRAHSIPFFHFEYDFQWISLYHKFLCYFVFLLLNQTMDLLWHKCIRTKWKKERICYGQ